MKKKSVKFDGEIDIIDGFKFIWKNKIKIFIFLLISVTIGSIYSHLTPKKYETSILIKSNSSSEFIELQNLSNSLGYAITKDTRNNKGNLNFNLAGNYYLDRFIQELLDYDELVYFIKKNEELINNQTGLAFEEKKFYKIAKTNFTVNRKSSTEYILKLKWNDVEEAESIILNTINLTKDSLNKSIFFDLKNILEINKEKKRREDLKRINYLTEQSSIAKEFSIGKNKDFINFMGSLYDLELKTDDIFGDMMFLRRHESIDKEINLIKNRSYEEFEITKNEINRLEALNLNWVEYNWYLIDSELLNKSDLVRLISILIGLIVGIIYSLISVTFQKKRVYNKN